MFRRRGWEGGSGGEDGLGEVMTGVFVAEVEESSNWSVVVDGFD